MEGLAAGATALVLAAAATAAGGSPVVTWGNGHADQVRCGKAGTANVDAADATTASCRTVLVRIASDRTSRAGAQHATVAEPDAHAVGDTIVAVFQEGRFEAGASAAIGFATSRNGGRTWRDGLLPGTGPFGRATDPAVTFDAVHRVWLTATLGVTRGRETGLLVIRSADGLRWGQPVVVDRADDRVAPGEGEDDGDIAFDKDWVTCDTWPSSPFRGTCYLAYTDIGQSGIAVRASTDGGLTWSGPVVNAPGEPSEVGAYPVVRPDGTLVLLWTEEQSAVVATRSTDGGATFTPPVTVDSFHTVRPRGVRAVSIPTADVGPDGRVWAAWQGCPASQTACERTVTLVSSSGDGTTWSPPAELALPAQAAYAPVVAVDPHSGRIGVVAYGAAACPSACSVDGWLLESADGSTWGAPRRLTAESILLDWQARSNLGGMLGDYFALVYVRGRPVPVITIAREGRGRSLRQAAFAALRVAP